VTLHANSVAWALCNSMKFVNSDEDGNGVNCTAGQTMTEPEKPSDLGEISAVTVRLGVG